MSPLASVDEIVESLKRSSLPTIVIEGADDLIVFRPFEEMVVDFGVSVLPVGGRGNVLKIFERLDEIGRADIVFFADQDSWIYSEIPNEYVSSNLIFTNGYSIENDAYSDADFEKYMTKEEFRIFCEELVHYIRWFALAVERRCEGQNQVLDIHPNALCEDEEFCEAAMLLVDGESYPEERRQAIFKEYKRLLRGKSLVALLVRRLSKSGRRPKYNAHTLLDIAANNRGPLLEGLFEVLAKKFDVAVV